MIKKGIIIDGVTYKFASVTNKDVEDCEQCDLFMRCHNSTNILCRDIFGDNVRGKVFQKQTEQ